MHRFLSTLLVVFLIVSLSACQTRTDGDAQAEQDQADRVQTDEGDSKDGDSKDGDTGPAKETGEPETAGDALNEKGPNEKGPNEKGPNEKGPNEKGPNEKGDDTVTAEVPAAKPVDLNLLKMDVLTEQELADGWLRLFDGLTLFGWEPTTSANWRVEDGAIVVDDGIAGLLCTNVDFADYVLKLDFKAEASTNSGVFLRTPATPTDPATDCYELNIAPDDNPFPTGSLVKRHKTEGHNSDDWQTFEVTLSGATVTIKLNGEQIAEYHDDNPVSRGRIGLQLNQGKVAFRNIFLKPLSLQPIFDGKSLDGWKTYPEMPGKFTVGEDGHLHVANGSGQLETSQSYGDFALQLQCRTNAPHLNSGIFFRCIPGEKMNGYESQIQNQLKSGPTDPFDCGTGGIFRRVNARIVAATDQKWFHNTIIASGSRFGIWVNGLQVTAWTDDRKPDDNPRKGLRTAPGTIMIQAHDPTTDIDFRELKIATLPE